MPCTRHFIRQHTQIETWKEREKERKAEGEKDGASSSFDLVAAAAHVFLFYSKWIFELCVFMLLACLSISANKRCSVRSPICHRANATNANRNKLVSNICDASRVERTHSMFDAHHFKASIFNSKLTADVKQGNFVFSILPPKCFDC